jgi:tetratricopeptide (TPR) repeat protein
VGPTPFFRRSTRAIGSVARIVAALIVIGLGARLTFRPDRLDALRRADSLFVARRYHDARAAYAALVASAPDFALARARLGMVFAIRNERTAADESLARAIGLGLDDRYRDLTRLYQGQVSAARGLPDEAAQLWATIGERSSLYPLRRVLEGEQLLFAGDYAGAEAAYRAAEVTVRSLDWRTLIQVRLATLSATSDPAKALAELARPAPPDLAPASEPFVAPLLPTSAFDARQLAAALRAPADQRAQLLGQLYLGAGLYRLAEAQFAAVAPGSPSALAAAAYAAYARWSAGDRAEGLRRLNALVAAHPEEPRARALLALAYLSNRDQDGARAQLERARTLAPRAPDVHLAWGQWYTAQHDYIAAAEEYRRALSDAPPEERGTYALTLARFHLETSVQVCAAGRPAAEEAARLLPDDPRALIAAASARFICGDPDGARVAAERALQRSPNSAEASYYLGRALAALGDRAAARLALVNAADLAPASPWRERAEAQIATLGL